MNTFQEPIFRLETVYKFTFSFHTKNIVLRILKILLIIVAIFPLMLISMASFIYGCLSIACKNNPILFFLYLIIRFLLLIVDIFTLFLFLIANLPECKQFIVKVSELV